MKRRQFIKSTSLAGLSFPILTLSFCKSKDSSPSNDFKAEINFSTFELNEFTIDMLREKMETGVMTCEQITRMYIERINQIDKDGPKLNSVIELNPDALKIAQQMDTERKSGTLRGSLHGIPVLIKDNIDTGDKMMTTAGALALEGHYAAKDAFIVSKLREAGAVILGKTNLSEWANFRSSRSSSGWSSRGGQTKNPYLLNRNPCGSSSGSGAAVSSNLCAVAIGTETNGSIACPSSINGVVGLKPTVGLLSRSGIIPISSTQDTAGPMARTVKDTAILLGILAGPDPFDKVTLQSVVKKMPTDYTKFLNAEGLKGKRIGVEKSFLKVHETVDALFKKAMDQMKTAGAEIIEIELISTLKIDGAEYSVLQYEFKEGLNKYLAKANAKVRSLKEIIEFNTLNESKVMPFFKQEILESSEEKKGLDSKEYKEALEKVLSVRQTIIRVMTENKLDAICGPANGPSWCTDLVNGDSFTGYGMYSPAAMAGFPHITVPMGLAQGLPIGLNFCNRAFDEPVLLGIAYAYEQVSKNRIIPEFRNSLEG